MDSASELSFYQATASMLPVLVLTAAVFFKKPAPRATPFKLMRGVISLVVLFALAIVGEHFHWDSDKSERLSEHEPPELLLFSFLSAITQASAAYDALAEVGVAALDLGRRAH